MSLHFIQDANGLQLVIDKWSTEVADPFEALLKAANIQFIKGQVGTKLVFKVEPRDVLKVRGMLGRWAVSFDDMNHAMSVI
jgi:hypothetical protein